MTPFAGLPWADTDPARFWVLALPAFFFVMGCIAAVLEAWRR